MNYLNVLIFNIVLIGLMHSSAQGMKRGFLNGKEEEQMRPQYLAESNDAQEDSSAKILKANMMAHASRSPYLQRAIEEANKLNRGRGLGEFNAKELVKAEAQLSSIKNCGDLKDELFSQNVIELILKAQSMKVEIFDHTLADRSNLVLLKIKDAEAKDFKLALDNIVEERFAQKEEQFQEKEKQSEKREKTLRIQRNVAVGAAVFFAGAFASIKFAFGGLLNKQKK